VTLTIGLIDYGMGNLHSVNKSFARLKQSVKLIRSPNDLTNSDALVLPGVGAFDPAMDNLRQTNLIPHIKKWVVNGQPLLGICLGLQLLFETSEEGSSEGLSLFKGHVKKLPSAKNERIPHMGWSIIDSSKNCPILDKQNKNEWMYFVHSYHACPIEQKDLAATCKFGDNNLTAIVWKDRLGACQFHPEKSSEAGNQMLAKWIIWLNKGAKIHS